MATAFAECLAALLASPQALLSPCPGASRVRGNFPVAASSDTARSASRALSFRPERRGLSRIPVKPPVLANNLETVSSRLAPPRPPRRAATPLQAAGALEPVLLLGLQRRGAAGTHIENQAGAD